MIKLFHTTPYSSIQSAKVRKVVYNISEYIDGDNIFYTISDNVSVNVKLILTTSKDIFEKYKNLKEIIYFEKLDEVEEYAILKLERNSIYLTFLPSSNAHTLFFTSRCNHYCLMCSEPPKIDNDDYLIQDNLKIIELLDKELPVLGISGGEPTLLGSDFIKIIKKIRQELPQTEIRVLTNGRAYTNEKFVQEIADIAKGYFVSEIPIYHSDFAKHDYIVQSRNAFFETIDGFYKCATYGLSTEVRVVISKQNYDDLADLMYFIYRNIPFVDHIALMGLEYIGFALNNLKTIHISPLEYMEELKQAIKLCRNYALPVSIYNLPLCLVHKDIRHYARQSISDWKNEFSKICYNCEYKNECAGMFTSTQPFFEALLKPIIKNED